MGNKLTVGVIAIIAIIALLIGSFFLFGQGTFADSSDTANSYQPIPASCSNSIESCIDYVTEQSGESRSSIENKFAFRCVQSSCEGKLR